MANPEYGPGWIAREIETVAGPLTTSPAAYTSGTDVAPVSGSAFTVPHLVISTPDPSMPVSARH